MTTRRQPLEGPSRGLRSWWRLTIESVVCVVLVGAVITLWVRGPVGWPDGTATALMIGLVLRIVWHET